jgi:RNA polymerase sigma factor (sigma-70 family)
VPLSPAAGERRYLAADNEGVAPDGYGAAWVSPARVGAAWVSPARPRAAGDRAASLIGHLSRPASLQLAERGIGSTLSQTVGITADPAAGAASDFVEVYETHYGRLVRALEIGGLDRASAEDAAQEAFARTLGHWRRVRLGTNPAGYVYRVGFRLARRTLRREEPLRVEPQSLSDVAGEVTTRTAVETALAAMPPRRRSCAVMCLMSGFTTKEAARALGIAEGTVRKQLELARTSLRAVLGDAQP